MSLNDQTRVLECFGKPSLLDNYDHRAKLDGPDSLNYSLRLNNGHSRPLLNHHHSTTLCSNSHASDNGVDKKAVTLDTSSSSATLYPEAPDGGYGWVVVLAAFLSLLIADGIGFSFGVLYIHMQEYYQSTKGDSAIVASLFYAVPLITAPIATAFIEEYDCRLTTVVGGLIAFAGFLLSLFAPSIPVLCLTLGVIAGFGLSFVFAAPIVAVTYYFDKRRSFATSLAVTGSGIGTFLFAPLIRWLVDEYSWKGAILILSGIVLNLVLCGLLIHDLQWPEDTLAYKRAKFLRMLESTNSAASRSHYHSTPASAADNVYKSYVCREVACDSHSRQHRQARRALSLVEIPVYLRKLSYQFHDVFGGHKKIVEGDFREAKLETHRESISQKPRQKCISLGVTSENSDFLIDLDKQLLEDGSEPSAGSICVNSIDCSGGLGELPEKHAQGSDECSTRKADSEDSFTELQDELLLSHAKCSDEFRRCRKCNKFMTSKCLKQNNYRTKGASSNKRGVICKYCKITGANKLMIGEKCIRHRSSTIADTWLRNLSDSGESILNRDGVKRGMNSVLTSDSRVVMRSRSCDAVGSVYCLNWKPGSALGVVNIPPLDVDDIDTSDNLEADLEATRTKFGVRANPTTGAPPLSRRRKTDTARFRVPRDQLVSKVVDGELKTSTALPSAAHAGYLRLYLAHYNVPTKLVLSAPELRVRRRPSRRQETVPRRVLRFATEGFKAVFYGLTVLREIRFSLFCLSNFLLYSFYDLAYVNLPDYVLTAGVTEKEASFLVSIIGIFNTAGMLLIGAVSDVERLNRLLLYSVCMLTSGCAIIVTPWVESYWVFCVLCAVFGLTISANYVLTSVIIVDVLTLSDFVSAYGIVNLAQGIGNLIGPAFAGYMFDWSGSYSVSFIVGGCGILMSGLLVLLSYAISPYQELPELEQDLESNDC